MSYINAVPEAQIPSFQSTRAELWHPGHVAETPSIATEENLEALPVTKGKPAVRARIKPAPKKEGGE
jgi:hypothetical protein